MLALLMLASCDATVKVAGALGDGTPVSGSLTQYSDGGTIELYGAPRMHCVGSFRYRQANRIPGGAGTLICDDRRSGPFRFAMRDMKHGSGTGTLGDQPLAFSF
ncbi:hypothetical protein [Rhizorhabdus argentea]|uniref:hypothetical protein n=1 Tax=Rhizorhabdus argentea TaxID=1387174 RepID=UPI0030EE8DF0